MSAWDKQEWIKDILSKSGTEITEIKDVKDEDLRKMVYYTTALMQSAEQAGSTSSLCSSTVGSVEGHTMYQLSSSSQAGVQPSPFTNLTSTSYHGLGKVQELQVQHSLPATVATSNSPQKPQFKCEQCNMCFGSKSAHTSHMKSHSKQFQQQNVTGPVTQSPSPPSSASSTTSSDPYQCDVCKKTFAVPARLVRHYRTHTGERPFECEFCHKMFSVKENLQVHRRIHTKERPYKCDVCGRAFEHSGKLHRHMRIHTGERPHKCSVCGKTFIQSGQLVIHMRTHTGEKPYKCPVEGCGKGFTCSKQLKVHSRTHTGEKPYHCDICFRDFGYNHVLKLHRVQHYGSKCYKCTICDETFKNKKDMEAHIKGHANSEPDDEEMDQSPGNEKVQPEKDSQTAESSTSVSAGTNNGSKYLTEILSPETNSSSEPDDVAYYNMYPPSTPGFDRVFTNGEQQVSCGGVNPALLAAVSIEMANNKNRMEEEMNAASEQQLQPPAPAATLATTNALPIGIAMNTDRSSSTSSYETITVMRQGYFAATQHVPEYKSSSNDIVRCVEAALASTEPTHPTSRSEPLLTPPRSSPESPDRSSSPESDCILMADRDIMSLPPRKRKLYLKDQSLPPPSSPPIMEQLESLPPTPPISLSNSGGNTAANSQRRMGSVIQFANKAS